MIVIARHARGLSYLSKIYSLLLKKKVSLNGSYVSCLNYKQHL